ncbi:MAG TPA: nucleotide disphospho-sugar-binding domain-containing protein [Streptosporangiaceae bacterium]|jgi:glycosyltransferase
MKLLFTAGGGQAAVFGAAPLATAARNAGHDILLALDEPLLATAEAIGIPAVSISTELLRYGHELGAASARLEAMADLAQAWSPDVVVGGLSYVPGLLATRLKVPYVRQAWVPTTDMPARAARDLRLELERLGMTGLPDPDLFIDVCPPSLRPASAAGGQPMRWVPRNRQRRLEPWMYTPPSGRQRVLITSGTRTLVLGIPGRSIRRLLDQLALAGAEVLIAAPEGAAEKLGIELGDVHVGWIPLDVVAPTCDLVVHHGGATTATTVMNAGVPHLIMPDNGYGAAVARAVAGSGAALVVTPPGQGPGADSDSGQDPTADSASDADPAEAIAAGCREILGTPPYTERARALAQEIAGLPVPAEVVRMVETLAAR